MILEFDNIGYDFICCLFKLYL